MTAFHHAFAASIVFGLVGIAFALRIRDEDAAASMRRPLSDISNCERDPLNQVSKYHRLALGGHHLPGNKV